MYFYVAVLVVIALCLIGIGVIVVRKFPQLVMIDTQALPQARENKKKMEIIESRVRRAATAGLRGLVVSFKPFVLRVRDRFRSSYARILSLDKSYRNQEPAKPLSTFERRLRAAKLIDRASALVGEGKSGEAEKLLVEAIGFDARNLDAYRVLGDLYMEQKNYLQARETYDFLARACVKECCARRVRGQQPRRVSLEMPCDAPAAQLAAAARNFVSLAAASRQLGEWARAKSALEAAAAHEPANPRTLDLLIEASVAADDKERAAFVLHRLETTNADNQKLGALREKIAAMPDNPVRGLVGKTASLAQENVVIDGQSSENSPPAAV